MGFLRSFYGGGGGGLREGRAGRRWDSRPVNIFGLFRRFRRGWGGELTPEVDAKTSNIPFLALLSGDQQWSALRNELKPVNSVLAVLLCATWRLRPAALQF